MPSIFKFVTALKMTWLRRLIMEQKSDWSKIFQIIHSSSIKINYGRNWMKILSKEKRKMHFRKKF